MKRIRGALLFLFLMLVTAIPVSASGQEVSEGHGVYINPLYADLGIEIPEDVPDDGIATISTPTYYSTTAKAADFLCDAMVARKKNISFKFYSKKTTDEEALQQLIDVACEADDTTAPNEGDYLLWHICGYSYNYAQEKHSGGYDYTFSGIFYYYSTAAQEKQVTAKIAEVMALPEIRAAQTEYETIRAIYNYVTSHVEYDFSVYYVPESFLPFLDPSPFSAYDALCHGSAVCQGYASLIYRMAREAGLSVRFIAGDSEGEGHAWNIVRIGGLYYNLDSTWDAGMSESRYEYFLRGDTTAQFPDHTRDPEYRTTAFYAEYPMSSVAYAASGGQTPSGNSISYVLNGGTNSADNPETYFREQVTLLAPSREGYAFAGWYTDSGFKNKITSIPATAAKDYTLYAKWTKVTVGSTKVTAYRANGNGFTVKFKAVSGADGYRIIYSHSADFADGTVLYKDVSGSSTACTVRVDDAATRYYVRVRAFKKDSAGEAVWGSKTSVVKGYQIKYVTNGGTNYIQNPYFIYNWGYTLKNPTRTGYKFQGWYTDKKFKNKIKSISKSNKKNRTLYARWKKK